MKVCNQQLQLSSARSIYHKINNPRTLILNIFQNDVFLVSLHYRDPIFYMGYFKSFASLSHSIHVVTLWRRNCMHMLNWEHAWVCTGPHHTAPHSVRQCGQHKWPEAYTPNMLMHCVDLIQSLSAPIRVSFVLCVFSVDSFFAVSVASAANRRILFYSE